ncbi:helix-turn-helix transcriptional regulator [Herbaspirillum sp. GCM10030257]|uniref:helix-turn-helix transcriptional regulator n=1 Tax=Herbaspirillum sp. GCM10030257 TaxID=3273393 RepID=UPI0036088001
MLSAHPKDRIDLTEACALCQASAATIYRWRKHGSFPQGQRIPSPSGPLYFPKAAVEQFAAKRLGEVA